jgi:hypothetical protein
MASSNVWKGVIECVFFFGPKILSKCEKIIIGVATPTKDLFFKFLKNNYRKKKGFGIGFAIFRAPTLASHQNDSKIIKTI